MDNNPKSNRKILADGFLIHFRRQGPLDHAPSQDGTERHQDCRHIIPLKTRVIENPPLQRLITIHTLRRVVYQETTFIEEGILTLLNIRTSKRTHHRQNSNSSDETDGRIEIFPGNNQ